MNCDFIDLKQETVIVNLENLVFSLVSDRLPTGLPNYLLFPIVLSGLPTGDLL